MSFCITFHNRDPLVFFICFVCFNAIFYGAWRFPRDYDGSISFYREGIANRSKGRKTPYDHYAKAVIGRIHFENSNFQVITFISKRKAWATAKSEYGFSTDDDLTPLLILLIEQGLPVEERIEGARQEQFD